MNFSKSLSTVLSKVSKRSLYVIVPSVIAAGAAYFYLYRDRPKPSTHASKDQVSKLKTQQVKFEMISTNGIKLHTLCAGDPANPLVILLHGFPEFWKGWELQIDALVNAGYYVMVPDQRGYNLSSKPLNISDYRIENLVGDILGLLESTGKGKALLGGHDWGGVVAWYLASARPDKFEKLFIANAPHPHIFWWYYKNDKEQYKKSSYMRAFLFPYLPQRKIASNNFEFVEKALVKGSKEGSFSSEDIKAYKLAWSDPGTFNGMLNWYRAFFFQSKGLEMIKSKVKVPVFIAWGVEDTALKYEMGVDSLKHCENAKIEKVEEATHWILHEQPEKISQLMIEFFKA